MAPAARVVLVDATPYLLRAWFALPATIVDARGRPVGAVRGFASFLVALLERERPSHLALCFDESLVSSFRNELHAGYKAQRAEAPAELAWQLRAAQRLARALGLVALADRRYEADDLLASLATHARRARLPVSVVSPDKDLLQLVAPGLVVCDWVRERRYDTRAVVARLGVRPAQVPDWLGLAGDAVDAIPGVPGVGAKTAAALLARFRDLEALYRGIARVERLPLRGARQLAARLAAHEEQAFLSRELATLVRDVPLALRRGALRVSALRPGARRERAFRLDRLRPRPPRPSARRLLAELGLTRLAERFAQR